MGNTIRSRLWLLLVAQNLWQVCSLPGSGELKKKNILRHGGLICG